MEIIETEEYLGFLRAKRLMIETRVAEADEQIGVLCEVMDQHQIPDILTSVDDEPSLPPSSSSLGSDGHTELLASDDYAALSTVESGPAADDSHSTSPEHQTSVADPIEDSWVRWGVGGESDLSDQSDEEEVE